MLSRCTFRTASAAVILTYVEFKSAAEASTWYTSGLAESQGDAATKVSMDEKAGATAFWATTQAGEGYTLAHARYVVAVGAGGPGFHPLSGQPLRLLALELDKRLQP